MTPKLTDEGKKILLKALTGKTITFTKIQFGNGSSDEQVKAIGLTNPIITTEISKIAVGTEYVTLTTQFSNSSVESGFHITEMGIFAKNPDDDTKEVLYALGNENESVADYIPDKNSRILEMQFDAIVFIGEAENVTAAISSSLVYASKEDFDEHTADKNNPHSVTKEQVGLGNVPNLAPSDQTQTFTQALSFANIESGEKASTLFGKIKLAIGKLMEHLNDSANPHGLTTAQIGAAAIGHTHNAQDINGGTLTVLRGGTGKSSWNKNGILYADKTDSLAQLALPDNKSVLVQENEAPSWVNFNELSALQGFEAKETVFNADGSITETNALGHTLHTVFNADGSITETFTGEKTISKKTTFNSDGSISEVLI